MVTKKNLYTMLLLILSSCGRGEFEPLQFERKHYTSNELRMDGYYYCKGIAFSDSAFNAIFLYRNGVHLAISDKICKTLEEVESQITTTYLSPTKKDYSQLSVGLFFVEGKQITMQRWVPVSNGNYPSVVKTGEIINDTIFRLKLYGLSDDLWRFKAFTPKPDSTNRFIP